MSQQRFAEDYIDVASRIVEFRQKYPEGSLQPADLTEPVKVITVGDKTFLQYVACAYRTPDDQRPGVGTAWEVFPGRTPYTKDSEAMVVETSAWGRAIVAALAADTKKGVASADEVRTAQERRKTAAPPAVSLDELIAHAEKAKTPGELDAIALTAVRAGLSPTDLDLVKEVVKAQRAELTAPAAA